MWRSEALARAVTEVEASLAAAWDALLRQRGVEPGTAAEQELASAVADDPAGHDWRVYDAALLRLSCAECGSPLAAGPPSCPRCELHVGLRFGAQETDRAGVPPGNEHAVRVASAVARTRHRYSPRARVGYELLLPALLAGALPTTAEAQAGKALINRLTAEECDRVTDLAEVTRLVRDRPKPGSQD